MVVFQYLPIFYVITIFMGSYMKEGWIKDRSDLKPT